MMTPDQGGGASLSVIARAAAMGTGADTSGTLQGDLPGAVASARAEGEAAGRAAGHAEGVKAAHTRLAAVLGNEAVKGRESAAIDLAIASPDMSADAVVAFVTKHGASASAEPGPKRDRLDAAMSDQAVTHDAPGTTASAADVWDGIVSGLNAAAKAGRL